MRPARAATRVDRRLADQPVVYEGDGRPATGQISSCIAVRDVLIRAGLGKEPGVRPASVAGWAGRQILEETGPDRRGRPAARDGAAWTAPPGSSAGTGRPTPDVTESLGASGRSSGSRRSSPTTSCSRSRTPSRRPTRLGAGGRRTYPAYMWLLFDALLSVYGSARRVEAELRTRSSGATSARSSQQRFPDEPPWLPTAPMRRHHYLYGRTRWLTHPEVLADLARDPPRARRRPGPRARAPRPGRARARGPTPTSSRMLYADGKVITPLFQAHPGDRGVDQHDRRDPPGPRRARRRAALRRHRRDRVGHQVGASSPCAPSDVHGRIILDVDWVPSPGGEAATAMDCFAGIAARVPGRAGRHLRHRAARRAPPDAPPRPRPAARQPGHRRQGRRQEAPPQPRASASRSRPTSRTDQSPSPTARPRPSSLFAQGGAVGIGTLTDTGDLLFTAAPADPHPPQGRQERQYRWYNDYRAPRPPRRQARSPSGSTATTKTRSGSSTAPRTSDPSRRATPTSSGSTADATTPSRINRALDDTLFLRRAHSRRPRAPAPQPADLRADRQQPGAPPPRPSGPATRPTSSPPRASSTDRPGGFGAPGHRVRARREPPIADRDSEARNASAYDRAAYPASAVGGFLPRSLPAPPS